MVILEESIIARLIIRIDCALHVGNQSATDAVLAYVQNSTPVGQPTWLRLRRIAVIIKYVRRWTTATS